VYKTGALSTIEGGATRSPPNPLTKSGTDVQVRNTTDLVDLRMEVNCSAFISSKFDLAGKSCGGRTSKRLKAKINPARPSHRCLETSCNGSGTPVRSRQLPSERLSWRMRLRTDCHARSSNERHGTSRPGHQSRALCLARGHTGEFGDPDVLRETKLFQYPNTVIVRIEFIPCQAVTG
jgi:hypothetical protein